MPTLSAITVSQPSWLQEELRAIAENEQVSYLKFTSVCQYHLRSEYFLCLFVAPTAANVSPKQKT